MARDAIDPSPCNEDTRYAIVRHGGPLSTRVLAASWGWFDGLVAGDHAGLRVFRSISLSASSPSWTIVRPGEGPVSINLRQIGAILFGYLSLGGSRGRGKFSRATLFPPREKGARTKVVRITVVHQTLHSAFGRIQTVFNDESLGSAGEAALLRRGTGLCASHAPSINRCRWRFFVWGVSVEVVD